MKKFLLILGGLAAIFLGFRLWAYLQNKKIAAIWPVRDDRVAAQASATQDALSLSAVRSVIPPSAQNLRTTIGTLDANRIGGNITSDTDLVSIQKWSVLGSGIAW